MSLDLPRGHPPRIERQYLVVEARPARLMFGHDLGLETTLPVSRYLDFHFSKFAFQRLATSPITSVGSVPFGIFLVTEVVGQFTAQRPFDQRLCQLFQQSAFADQVLRLLIALEKFVYQLWFQFHFVLPSL